MEKESLQQLRTVYVMFPEKPGIYVKCYQDR